MPNGLFDQRVVRYMRLQFSTSTVEVEVTKQVIKDLGFRAREKKKHSASNDSKNAL